MIILKIKNLEFKSGNECLTQKWLTFDPLKFPQMLILVFSILDNILKIF